MVYAVVPVKHLSDAKSRLATRLSPVERGNLSLLMLQVVLRSLKKCPGVERTIVVSSDDGALKCAEDNGMDMLREKDYGDLNAAINQATARCAELGAAATLVLPADLPLITSEDITSLLHKAVESSCIVIVPSRDGNGTNALLRIPEEIIPPRFGPDSLSRHLQEAVSREVPFHMCHIPNVELDIDTPEDLGLLFSKAGNAAPDSVLHRIVAAARI